MERRDGRGTTLPHPVAPFYPAHHPGPPTMTDLSTAEIIMMALLVAILIWGLRQ
jgi:hypothetical protein